MTKNTLTVVGSDRRLDFVSDRLASAGFTVEKAENSRELEEISTADVLILPLPYVSESGTVKGTDILPCDLLPHLSENSKVILGKADEFILRASRAIGFSFTDINADHLFKQENATPSAEAAIRIAMEASQTVLCQKNVVILGFGCIAKRLVSILSGFRTQTSVICRNPSDRIFAEMCGCRAFPFDKINDVIGQADIIFNTCPAPVLPASVLCNVRSDCVIIDVASRPGGCDFDYARSRGINAGLYLGLPDKYYRETAKKVFLDAILRSLDCQYDLNERN